MAGVIELTLVVKFLPDLFVLNDVSPPCLNIYLFWLVFIYVHVFFFSTQNESSDTCCTCILISETKFGGWDGSASQSLAQCLYGADTLCWNLTANDRSSTPSLVWPLPLHPLCSHSVRYRISWTPNANNSLLVFLSIKKKKSC